MSNNNRPGPKTAIDLAYEFVLAQLAEQEQMYRDDDEIYQVLSEAMKTQMPRWAAHDDPVPALKALLTRRWEMRVEQPFPSDDADDQYLYLLGLLDGMIMSYPLRALTPVEEREIRTFAQTLCGASLE